MKLKIVLFPLAAILPWSIRRRVLCRVYGWEIHRTAFVSRFCLMDVHTVKLDAGSRIGALSVISGLHTLSMGRNAIIGKLNWIAGVPLDATDAYQQLKSRDPSLYLGSEAAITTRHFIDCTESINIGEFSTFAGFRSQMLTHSIDLLECRQSAQPIRVGRYCFIGTGTTVIGGSSIPDYSVVAAGAVVASKLEESYWLYGGVPAKPIRQLDDDMGYFTRETGRVK